VIWPKILTSLSITVGVSVVCSLFLLNFGFNFFYSILFFILLQIIGFYFYGEYVRQKNNKLAVLAEIKAMETLAQVTVDVLCPCDKQVPTTLPLSLRKKNEYICSGCNKKVSVILEPKTALTTEPMNSTLLDDVQFINKIEKLTEIKENVVP
jgi:hypothetical protein